MARTAKSLLDWDDDLWSGLAFSTGAPIAPKAAGNTVAAVGSIVAADTTIGPVPAVRTGAVVAAASVIAAAKPPKPPPVVTLLDPATQPKFVNSLPIPPVIDATKGGTFTVRIEQTKQWLGLISPNGKQPSDDGLWLQRHLSRPDHRRGTGGAYPDSLGK